MRIGFDAKRAFHNVTGLGNYSRFTIEALSEFFPQNQYFLFTPPFKKGRWTFHQKDNLKVIEPTGLWAKLASLWRTYAIANSAKKLEVDIFHGLSHELPIGIEKTGIKTVVTIHDLIFLRYPSYYKAIDRNIYRNKFYSACKRADLIVAISEQTKKDIVDYFKIPENKIRLVYQGCDPSFYTPANEIQKQEVRTKYNLPEKYILSVGTIEERKNLLTVVRSLPLLPEDVYLLAVGKPSQYLRFVKEEAQKLKVEDRIIYLHNASFTDFPSLYANAKVFVYPSVFEGFGIPILEALNCGVPVIAASTSSLPEVGGSAAIYMEPYNFEQLSEHIKEIEQNAELRNGMIARGKEQALKFRNETTIQQLWKVYSELIEK